MGCYNSKLSARLALERGLLRGVDYSVLYGIWMCRRSYPCTCVCTYLEWEALSIHNMYLILSDYSFSYMHGLVYQKSHVNITSPPQRLNTASSSEDTIR